ncbi:MAG: hypothetical protein IT230_06915 [Flavobacteriales bacterium]|nr:hypothetical protein [Flavobacteriales bacterium]
MEPNELAGVERSYAEYKEVEHLSFDPLIALNLPATYEEVVQRYKRLRGESRPPSLN